MSAPISQPTDEDPRSEVRWTLQRLSAAWQERRYQELASFFDSGVVMMLPGLSGRIEGRAAVIDSFMEFMEHATVSDFVADSPTIDIWGDTAIASYHWEMTWVRTGKEKSAAGYDVFVFSRSNADRVWRAVWRTMALDSASRRESE